MGNLESRLEKLEAKRPLLETVVIRSIVHENNPEEIAAADRRYAEEQAKAEAQGKQPLELRNVIKDWPKVTP